MYQAGPVGDDSTRPSAPVPPSPVGCTVSTRRALVFCDGDEVMLQSRKGKGEVPDHPHRGQRFSQKVRFLRWRPDHQPESCTFGHFEVPPRCDVYDVLEP